VKALVIEHDVAGPSGTIGEILEERGYALDEVMIGQRTLPDHHDAELIVVMGSYKSVYDDRDPLIQAELDYLSGAVNAGVPIFGICFGAQALATVLGGSVAPSPMPEVGWSRIASDDPDRIPEGPWFQWHYDHITLPPGVREIARNRAATQAFATGPHLGLQFHPEVTPALIAKWVADPADVARAGVDPSALIAETEARWQDARAMAVRIVDSYLASLATQVG
jgi:GMP synthase-like glutamine amidotransferase